MLSYLPGQSVIPPLVLIGVIIGCASMVLVALAWFLHEHRIHGPARRRAPKPDPIERIWSDLDSFVVEGDATSALEDLGTALRTPWEEPE